MKFFCNGLELSNATNIVSKAIAVNKNIPILEGIKISAQGTKVTLSACNQELYIEKTISADIYEEGDAIVNGKIFNDCANKISTIEKVGIEKDIDDILTITFGRSSLQLKYFESMGFAELGSYSDKNSFKIKENDFKELLERVIFCVSTGNDTRMLVKGCSLDIKGELIESVGLDGFRCAISKKPVMEVNGRVSCVVLGKVINDVLKILSDSEDYIKITNEDKVLIIDLGHTKIRTTLIDCEFFDYTVQMRKLKNSSSVIMNKEELINALNRASIISRENGHTIVLTIADNLVKINSDSEKGRIDDCVACKYDGEATKISLNNKYLMDSIQRIKEDYVKMDVEDARTPILIKRVDEEDYCCIILPIRMIS